MKTLLHRQFRIVPYGHISSLLESEDDLLKQFPASMLSRWTQNSRAIEEYVLVFATDVDETFTRDFRQKATEHTRLLVFFNKETSTDRLVSRIVNMQIRSLDRFYIVPFAEHSRCPSALPKELSSFVGRLVSGITADDKQDRILQAEIEDGILHIVSPDFRKLDVRIKQIPTLAEAAPAKLENFTVDEDGTFIYWPDLDLHLGWEQLEQIVNPDAARKAQQKSKEFNVRYGRAIKKVREADGLSYQNISGLSEKQLRRIEAGECRLTSNATRILAKAHRVQPNEYLKKLAEALE